MYNMNQPLTAKDFFKALDWDEDDPLKKKSELEIQHLLATGRELLLQDAWTDAPFLEYEEIKVIRSLFGNRPTDEQQALIDVAIQIAVKKNPFLLEFIEQPAIVQQPVRARFPEAQNTKKKQSGLGKTNAVLNKARVKMNKAGKVVKRRFMSGVRRADAELDKFVDAADAAANRVSAAARRLGTASSAMGKGVGPEVEKWKKAAKKAVTEIRSKKVSQVEDSKLTLNNIITNLIEESRRYVHNRNPEAPVYARPLPKKGKVLFGFRMTANTEDQIETARLRIKDLGDLLKNLKHANTLEEVINVKNILKGMIEIDLTEDKKAKGKFSPFVVRVMLNNVLHSVEKFENQLSQSMQYRDIVQATLLEMVTINGFASTEMAKKADNLGVPEHAKKSYYTFLNHRSEKLEQCLSDLRTARTIDEMREIEHRAVRIKEDVAMHKSIDNQIDHKVRAKMTNCLDNANKKLERLSPHPKVNRSKGPAR